MLAQNFEELARQLEDSQLLSYVFENKQVRFQLYHVGTAKLYSFVLPSDTIHGRTVTSDRSRSLCSIRLIDLRQRLDIRHDGTSHRRRRSSC